MDYNELIGLPPPLAYEGMPLCMEDFDGSPNGCPIISPVLFHPQLALPTQIRPLDPAWQTCGVDFRGAWDPPITLHPAESVDPVTTSVAPQYTVPASPKSTAAGPPTRTNSLDSPILTVTSLPPSSSDESPSAGHLTSSAKESYPAPGTDAATGQEHASTADPSLDLTSSLSSYKQVTTTIQVVP